MKFLNPYFLYFLPFAFLPLLIYLFDKIKRKPVIFPSVEIIEEIIKEKKRSLRLSFFLRQIIRTIILIMLIFSFARPVFDYDLKSLKDFTIIIDPTYSMKEFNLFEIIDLFKQNKIYVGMEEYKDEIFYEREADIVNIINRVIDKENSSSVLLVTDGQKVNFKKLELLSKNISNLVILLLKHTKNNFYFKELEIYPFISARLTEISIKAVLNTDEEVKVVFYLNDKPFAERNVKKSINLSFIPDKSMLKNGENILKLLIEANDFVFDNQIERGFYFIPIRVYIDRNNLLFHNYIKKIVRSLFGDIEEVREIKDANIVFINGLKLNNNVPTYIIPETGFDNKSLAFIKEEGEISGEINSESLPSLNIFKEIRLKNTFRYTGGIYDLTPCVNAGKSTIIYKARNTYLFTFPIAENISELSDNPFLAIFIYETFSSFYKDRINIKSDFPPEESDFEFYSRSELVEKVKKINRFINLKIFEPDKIKERKAELRQALLILFALFLILEALI
ncbi:MAG: BatA domain-containing protein [Brevinematia bacterium]